MIRMFFFDIDGTLIVPKKGEVSERVRRAIFMLHERGIVPILVSGRPLFSMIPLAESLSIRGCIAYNGGLVVVDGEVVYDNPIDESRVEQLVSFANSNMHPLIFPGMDGYYATTLDHPKVREIFQYTTTLNHSYWKHYTPKLNPSYWKTHPIYQMELIAPIEELTVYQERFGEEFQFYPWHVASSATNINPLANSKAIGMHHVLKRFSLDESVAAAIGDGPNDIEMIRSAHLGIAMGNACKELKSAADLVAEDVTADGAAKAIEMLLESG